MKIEDYSFGKIKIDGQEFNYDLLLKDFNNKESKKEIIKWVRKESHNIFISDLKKIKNSEYKKIKTIIIGTGNSGMMKVSDKIKKFIKNKTIKLIIKETPKAIKGYNETKGSKVGLLHLTC